MTRRLEPKPWPLRWIVLVILVSIGAYTYLTLHFRKTGHTYTPYEDLSRKATVGKLLSAGWQRVPVPFHRPADAAPLAFSVGMAKTEAAPGGFPPELSPSIVETTVLASEITRVNASALIVVDHDYPVTFGCLLADQKHQILEVRLYLKEQTAVLVPTFESIAGDLLARNRETAIELVIPAHSLRPGRYHVSLIGAKGSKNWELDVH